MQRLSSVNNTQGYSVWNLEQHEQIEGWKTTVLQYSLHVLVRDIIPAAILPLCGLDL